MKKIYVMPSIKVQKITITTVLAGSSVSVSNESASDSYNSSDGGGSGDAKQGSLIEF